MTKKYVENWSMWKQLLLCSRDGAHKLFSKGPICLIIINFKGHAFCWYT